MKNGELEKVRIILDSIQLSSMQEVDDHILTIQSSNSNVRIGVNGCMTRCLLLYLIKNKAFRYEIDKQSETNIFVKISEESISLYYEIIKSSNELKALVQSGSKNYLIIISRNRKLLLEKIN